MTKNKNSSASIHNRLLNKARASERPFNDLLQYYAIERFLYRLSQSSYKDKFILKGALAFFIWGIPLRRSTRDIDLLGFTSNEIENIIKIAQEICEVQVAPDGIYFDTETIKGALIKEDADYEGVRLQFLGYLGKARIKMQIDIGFSDKVFPKAVLSEYPTLLSLPAPQLHNYSQESVIAEKFQAMVYLGKINSRMKDFYDIWFLTHHFDFDGKILQEAISQTFEHRSTEISKEPHIVFSKDFIEAKQRQWESFLKRSRIESPPVDFQEVIQRLDIFLTPITNTIAEEKIFFLYWRKGDWQK
ncbi:MAG: nucleotidyl transferase AbiEii/AbiGii toxin family protein [Anaerolineae bacterium]|jgi:predicted nucleotidyltransferase component of viral defense system|nr:nucleotidyl transferase AbiEii/AbiGii toxin family protein [Anaerolineae bacterium]